MECILRAGRRGQQVWLLPARALTCARGAGQHVDGPAGGGECGGAGGAQVVGVLCGSRLEDRVAATGQQGGEECRPAGRPADPEGSSRQHSHLDGGGQHRGQRRAARAQLAIAACHAQKPVPAAGQGGIRHRGCRAKQLAGAAGSRRDLDRPGLSTHKSAVAGAKCRVPARVAGTALGHGRCPAQFAGALQARQHRRSCRRRRRGYNCD